MHGRDALGVGRGLRVAAVPAVARLFARDRRDFSHGCIRVQEPIALAKFVLQGQPEWTEARIREAIALDGVAAFVVACPKDITMYRDAVKTTGQENRLVVKDLIELVHEAMAGDGAQT